MEPSRVSDPKTPRERLLEEFGRICEDDAQGFPRIPRQTADSFRAQGAFLPAHTSPGHRWSCTAGANTHRVPLICNAAAKKAKKNPYIFMHTHIYICTYIPAYMYLRIYMLKSVYNIYTHIKTAIPAGSSHLPKPSRGGRREPSRLAKGGYSRGFTGSGCRRASPAGAGAPRGAMPESHPVAG